MNISSTIEPTTISSTATSTATITATDPTAIARSLFGHLEATWNRADAAAYGEAFEFDADFVDIRGVHHIGRPEIIAGHQHIFDTIYAGSTVHYELDRAREITPGCVVAVVAATLDAPHGPLQGVNHARFTLTIVATAGEWRISAFQNTLFPPAH